MECILYHSKKAGRILFPERPFRSKLFSTMNEDGMFSTFRSLLYTPVVSAENLVRKEIENSMSSTDAFAKYGVL